MAVMTDPRYQALAAQAAAGLGAGPRVQRAILAQFACEKRGEWPPQDMNPGNVHVQAMADAGYPGLPHGIGDSGAVARFATPQDGAIGYARYIGALARYRAARADIATDDGAAYLRDVTSAGYGTSHSCAAGYYGDPAGAIGPTTAQGDRTDRGGFVLPGPSAGATGTCNGGTPPNSLAAYVGHDARLTLADVPTLRDSIAAARAKAGSADKASDIGSYLVDVVGHCYSTIGLNINGPGEFQTVNGAPGPGIASNDPITLVANTIADLPRQLFDALGKIVVNGLVLAIVVLLAYRGVKGLVEP